MPIYRRSNSFRTKRTSSGRKVLAASTVLKSINQDYEANRKKKGLGLGLKFALPIIFVLIGVIALFTFFIARTSSEAIANEILKSGLAQATVLSDIGSMIIEKADRTYFMYGDKGKYEPWPVDLGLVTKQDFLKRVGYFDILSLPKNATEGFAMNQETLYAARTAGLLKRIIAYRSLDGVLHDSQTLAAYILVEKKEIVDLYLNDCPGQKKKNPPLLLLARSEMNYEIEKGKEGVLPIVKSDWISNYADISKCTIGEESIVFNTNQTPCVVYGAILSFSGIVHSTYNKSGKEEKSLVFDIPIYDNDNIEVGRAIVAMRASQIVERLEKTVSVFGIGALIAIALSIFTSFIVSNIVTKPIKLLIKDMEIVASGDLNHETLDQSNDEIGLIASEFNRITKILRSAAENEKAALKMENELDMAGEIQFKLLPTQLPEIKNIDIFAAYQPAKEVGGDYYDLFPIDDTHYGLVVADVSGKGVPGSMVMATTRTILRYAAKNNTSSIDTLMKTNSMVAADIKRGMFVTAFYLVLDFENLSLLCSSAGHNPMVVHHDNGEIELINPNGIAMGFDKGALFNKTIKDQEVQLRKGDRVILYTDGVIEAMSEGREEYSAEKFYDFIKAHGGLNSEEFVEALLEDVESHQGDREQHDDITILTFRVL